ncbi:MAG: OPT/YSL family transporter [Thermoplasmatales archaeon]|nr:OPT/YSL family transporter [Thermoplasmatales archaeon]
MGKVRKYSYREPPTPKGLKVMEKGTLTWFDIEMFSNLNTGCMEQYFEEKNRVDSFKFKFPWKRVIIGMLIGTVFAVITEYVGLKVGIALSGGWYVVYILGLALKWTPNDTNISAGASTGATYIATGFIFTFPALYLLAKGSIFDEYKIGGEFLIDAVPPLSVVLIATIISGFLGVLFFIIFRRIWLVEDPLHVPGIEANIKLLDLSHSVSKGAAEEARKALKLICASTAAIMVFVGLRDWPVTKMTPDYVNYDMYATDIDPYPHASALDFIFKHNTFYDKVDGIIQPYSTAKYTHLSFGLEPINFAIGWFMKWRTAFLVNSGTLLTWFVIVPLAVTMNVPIYDGATGTYYSIQSMGEMTALVAYARVARIIAIGTILGGGITGLIKMAPAFKTAASDVIQAGKGERKDFIPGRGWYEWPVSHIKIMAVLTLILVTLVFWLGGYPFIASLIFSIILVVTTFFLGAIAVKVMGETGSEPVSGTSFIVLLILMGLFLALGLEPGTVAVMAIIGTTVFAGAISMSGDIIYDFKSGLYCGNRPYYLMKGELIGIVPGAIVGAIGAVLLSKGLATGKLPLIAPQAHAFATMVQVVFGAGTMVVHLLLLGILIGVFMELITGMGTAFGLGMYFPLSIALPMLLGGGLRDIWEKKWLEPKAKKEKWDERQKTLMVLDTYMIMTGFFVGSALLGTAVAIYVMVGM